MQEVGGWQQLDSQQWPEQHALSPSQEVPGFEQAMVVQAPTSQ